MPMRSMICRAAGAMFCLLPLMAGAEALLKPLPTPDTAKLAPEVAKEVTAQRAEFEKAKPVLVDQGLAAAYAQIGAVYARAGLFDTAAIALYDASQLAPKDARWLYLRGVVARQQKLNSDARADFEAALAQDQTYLPIRMRLADTLTDLGDAAAAHKVLEAGIGKAADQSALLAMLGRIEARQHRYAEAIGFLNRALAAEPQANALYADLADAYTAQGNAAQAGEARAKAGTAQPTLSDPLSAAIYLHSGQAQGPAQQGSVVQGSVLEQARQLMTRGDIGAAHGKLEEALKAKPDDVDALALIARIDALVGRHEPAQEEVGRALKLKPDSAVANLTQAMVYEFAGDDANAFTWYQRSAHLDPRQADAQLLLGNLEMRRERYADAAEHYRQLATLTDESIEVIGRLVASQVAAGKCGDGLAHVNQQLVKRPKDGELMQIFVRLASTCPAAQAQERSMALDYAKALYAQRPNAGDTTALALATAAQGNFEDAQKYQAEAIYEAVRLGNQPLADMYRSTMKQFVDKKMPDRPWPSQHDYFKAARLQVLQATQDAPAQPVK